MDRSMPFHRLRAADAVRGAEMVPDMAGYVARDLGGAERPGRGAGSGGMGANAGRKL